MAEQEKKRGSAKRTVLLLVAILCFGVAAVCGFLLANQLLEYYNDNQAFEELASEVEAIKKPNEKIAKLQKKNPDTIGWLKVKDTRINYPVMYTPDDPEYYLHRNFKKEYSAAGTLFVGANCILDGNSFIIYGHHMRDGSMFATLLSFDKQDFAKSHDIKLTLTDGVHTYKPIACFYEDLSHGDYYHYWDYVGKLDEERYSDFVMTVKEKSLFDTGVKTHYDQKLLTLSTCSYGTSEQRFVVVAAEQQK